MADHARELGQFLLEQRGSLTTEVCKKAVDDAAARIERDKALRGVDGLIADLRIWLARNQSDPEACLAELRRVLLRSTEILRKSPDAPKNPSPTNGDKAKGTASHTDAGRLPSGKST